MLNPAMFLAQAAGKLETKKAKKAEKKQVSKLLCIDLCCSPVTCSLSVLLH